MPEPTPQPAPVLLSSVQRDGYRVEKWEFYPDDYFAVPYLALIPDGASKDNPVPGVPCFLGSNHTKEFSAGEPMPDHPNYGTTNYPDRNRMALYMVQNGMAAFVFDNPGIGECAIQTDPSIGQSQMYTRAVMCHGLLETGLPYVGLTVFQRMRFLEHLRTLPYVEQKNIAISSHSLGTEAAILMGLLCDDIKGIVFNEDLHDDRRRFMCITEHPGERMFQNYGNWHIVPGQFSSFGYQDPEKRNMDVPVPAYGLSSADFYRKYMYVTVSDHSFRKEPALKILKKCFDME